jgi:antitoxin HigA-1
VETGRGSTAFATTTNGESVSNGRKMQAGPVNVEIVDYHSGDGMARPAIHPGDQLAEELKALDMSAAELACLLKVPTNRVTAILNGQRAITGDTALRLGHYFGTTPEFWLNLQALYELRLAEQRSWQDHQGVAHAQAPALGGASVSPPMHDAAA